MDIDWDVERATTVREHLELLVHDVEAIAAIIDSHGPLNDDSPFAALNYPRGQFESKRSFVRALQRVLGRVIEQQPSPGPATKALVQRLSDLWMSSVRQRRRQRLVDYSTLRTAPILRFAEVRPMAGLEVAALMGQGGEYRYVVSTSVGTQIENEHLEYDWSKYVSSTTVPHPKYEGETMTSTCTVRNVNFGLNGLLDYMCFHYRTLLVAASGGNYRKKDRTNAWSTGLNVIGVGAVNAWNFGWGGPVADFSSRGRVRIDVGLGERVPPAASIRGPCESLA